MATESELTTEIEELRTAISNAIKTGTRYVVGAGTSRREFELDIDEARGYLADLENQLRSLQGFDGTLLGF